MFTRFFLSWTAAFAVSFALVAAPISNRSSAAMQTCSAPQNCSAPPTQPTCSVIGSAAPTCPIAVDTVNSHYFKYNGQDVALVGVSGEYLPQVSRGTDFLQSYCTYDNFVCYINDAVSRGLNKIRLYIGLNHSPGTMQNGFPYQFEQPFRVVNGKWDTTLWALGYFNRLQQVVSYCQSNNVIVEVTLFDPWDGDYTTSPWQSGNNNQGIQFTQRGLFCSFDNTTRYGHQTPPDSQNANQLARQVQLNVMQKVASTLSCYNNFYWELANEPDFNIVANPIDVTAMAQWHDYMANQLYSFEQSLGRHHPIAVNFHSLSALGQIPSHTDVLNAHYAALKSIANEPRDSAIDLIRGFYGGQQGSLGQIFGFNEGRITPIMTTSDGARAEAWEFMLGGGGVFDHLGYEWNDGNQDAQAIRTELGILSKFVNGYNLQFMTRQTSNPPAWLQNLERYGTAHPNYTTYWGAMQSRYQYALYIHHSTLTPDGALLAGSKGYVRVPGTYQENNLQFIASPAAAIGTNFLIEWVDPASGATYPGSMNQTWTGAPIIISSPQYSYDIALSIKRN
jgi:hypothetical protein